MNITKITTMGIISEVSGDAEFDFNVYSNLISKWKHPFGKFLFPVFLTVLELFEEN